MAWCPSQLLDQKTGIYFFNFLRKKEARRFNFLQPCQYLGPLGKKYVQSPAQPSPRSGFCLPVLPTWELSCDICGRSPQWLAHLALAAAAPPSCHCEVVVLFLLFCECWGWNPGHARQALYH